MTPRHPRRLGILAAALLLVSQAVDGRTGPEAGTRVQNEHQVKAAFLLNFVKYVEWPAGALAGDGRLTVAVLGDEGGGQMEEWLAGKSAQSLRLVVRRVTSVADIGPAQVVFVGADALALLDPVLKSSAGRPVLTVTDSADAAAARAVISLFVREGRIAFGVNLDAAASARLRLSSRLIALAQKVRREGRGDWD